MVTEPKVLYEFGSFQVDPEKQVLLRENEPIPITPKAFETLIVLIRHSREVVSKDDLMKAIWPDSFVEEANLSQNIFRLRKALGDAPGEQRYIVTVPGRGYRFVAQVRTVTVDGADVVIAGRSRSQMVIEQTDEPISGRVALPVPTLRTFQGKVFWVIGAAVGLLVVATVFFFHPRRQPKPLGEADTVVLADFTNTTGDSVFDETLRQGLAVQLEQSPFLSVVPESRVQRLLQLMGQSANARLTPALAREVCERNESAAVLDGSIAMLGSRYVIGLRATDCNTGKLMAEEQVQAARKEDVLDAQDQIATRFRKRVGESVTTVEKYDTPLAEATTPSLDAFNAYSAGWKLFSSKGPDAAMPAFKRATAIDPNFAMAYALLGRAYADTGAYDLATDSIRKAYELRDHSSDAEKFFISAVYEIQVTGDSEKAQQVCETWAQAYPLAMPPHGFLSGVIYPVLGRYTRAAEQGGEAIRLDPDFAIAYNAQALAYIALEQLGEAERVLQQASDRKLEMPDYAVDKYEIAFLKGDKAGMDRVAAEAQGKSGTEDMISEQEAFALAYLGHLQEARRKSQRAVDLARQSAQPDRAGLFAAGAAVQEALFGNTSEAKRDAMAALEFSRGREVKYGAAVALAVTGESSRSEALANDLEKRFPEDTAVKFSYLPAIRGLRALNRRDPAKAITLTQTAAPYESGEPPSSFYGYFGTFYPVYVRGEAYLAVHRGAEAAIEFQKILNHRGIVVSDPIGALARLQLARSFALSRDRTRAKASYEDFFTLWKEADPDIPLLRQAKLEYAKLH